MRTFLKIGGLVFAALFMLSACDEPGGGGGETPTQSPPAD